MEVIGCVVWCVAIVFVAVLFLVSFIAAGVAILSAVAADLIMRAARGATRAG